MSQEQYAYCYLEKIAVNLLDCYRSSSVEFRLLSNISNPNFFFLKGCLSKNDVVV